MKHANILNSTVRNFTRSFSKLSFRFLYLQSALAPKFSTSVMNST